MENAYKIGEKYILKKAHPCGSHVWEILRTGADFRIKCEKCGHIVWMSRVDFVKNVKNRAELASELTK